MENWRRINKEVGNIISRTSKEITHIQRVIDVLPRVEPADEVMVYKLVKAQEEIGIAIGTYLKEVEKETGRRAGVY